VHGTTKAGLKILTRSGDKDWTNLGQYMNLWRALYELDDKSSISKNVWQNPL
jgi:hypothetical protein